MRLRGPGCCFELGITPPPAGHFEVWCVVEVRWREQDVAWSTRDACLMTSEISTLADWLQRIADAPPSENDRLGFVEGELALEYIPSHRALAIELRYKLRPAGRYDEPDEPFLLHLPAESSELRRAATSVRERL